MTGKCKDCKYANEYIPHWAFRFIDPRCSLHHMNITPEDTCKYFEQIGRLSR